MKTLSRLYMSTLTPLKKINFCREGCLFFCTNSYRNFSKRQRTSNELKLRIHYISLGLPGSHFILYFLSIIRVPSAFSLSLLVSNSATCSNDLHMAGARFFKIRLLNAGKISQSELRATNPYFMEWYRRRNNVFLYPSSS